MNTTCLFSSKFNRITFNEVSVWLCVSASEWAELRPAGAEGRSLEDGVFRGLEQPVGTLRLQTAGILQVLTWYWPTSTDLDRPARFRTLCGIKSCDHKNNKNTMLFVRTSAVWPSAVCSVSVRYVESFFVALTSIEQDLQFNLVSLNLSQSQIIKLQNATSFR